MPNETKKRGRPRNGRADQYMAKHGCSRATAYRKLDDDRRRNYRLWRKRRRRGWSDTDQERVNEARQAICDLHDLVIDFLAARCTAEELAEIMVRWTSRRLHPSFIERAVKAPTGNRQLDGYGFLGSYRLSTDEAELVNSMGVVKLNSGQQPLIA